MNINISLSSNFANILFTPHQSTMLDKKPDQFPENSTFLERNNDVEMKRIAHNQWYTQFEYYLI